MDHDPMNRDVDASSRQIFGVPFTLASGKIESPLLTIIIPEGLNEADVQVEFHNHIRVNKMSIGAAKRAFFMAHDYQDYNSLEANALFGGGNKR